MSKFNSYCHACRSKSIMIEEKIPKYSNFSIIVGRIIATASIVCILIALAFAVVVIGKEFGFIEPSTYKSGTGGAIVIEEIQLSFSLFFGALSILGGLIGFVFLKKKMVYKCLKCESVIEKNDPSLKLDQVDLN
jgi:hypothetical protein